MSKSVGLERRKWPNPLLGSDRFRPFSDVRCNIGQIRELAAIWRSDSLAAQLAALVDTLRATARASVDHCDDRFEEFVLRLLGCDFSGCGGMGQGLGRTKHRPKTRGCDSTLSGEWREGHPALVHEDRFVFELDLFELRGTGQRRDHAGYLVALEKHAVDVRRCDDRRRAQQGGFARLKRGIHECGLASIELLIERRQQPGPRAEMVVNHGFCHTRLLGEPSKRQGFRAFLPDQPPGDVQQLTVSLFP